MNVLRAFLASSLGLLLLTIPVLGASTGGAKTVHVKGYTRKDGTYVAPHNRSAPGSGSSVGSSGGWVNSSPAPAPRPAPAQPSPPPANPPTPDRSEDNGALDPRVLQFHLDRAKAGSAASQLELGKRYLTGKGVDRNEQIARTYLTDAAKQDNRAAYTLLKNTDYGVEKTNSTGQVIQSTTARSDFARKSGYPSGKSGCVITHITPIEKGGVDEPANLQWEPIEDAMAKEAWK